MDRGDGRSIFGAVYIGIALLLLLLAYTNSTSSHGGWAAYQAFWTALITAIVAIFMGIVGVYKLLTSNKGKSTHEVHDYTKQGTDRETVQFLKTAGYPRLDDINHTAFNINDLLNLDPTAVKSKQLIWIANNKKSDWDVLRLTPMDLRLVGLQSINNNTQLTVDFDTSHSLSVEDYVMISNSQYEDLNGVYIVQSIPSPNSIIINYTKNISTLVGVSDKSTANTYGNICLLYTSPSPRDATLSRMPSSA